MIPLRLLLFSRYVMDSLQPHGLQHSRLPSPSLPPRVGSNSCPLSWWCCPTMSSSAALFSFCLQPFPVSESFPMTTLSIRWPKYWNFSFSISPSNKYSGLTSFRIDWFDLLAVQGTLKILLQHRSSKALILWRSAFLIVQLSHPYMTTGETIALTRRTFVGRVMSLPIRTRPNFPLSQSLPSGSFHKPLILFHQRADRLKTTITEH